MKTQFCWNGCGQSKCSVRRFVPSHTIPSSFPVLCLDVVVAVQYDKRVALNIAEGRFVWYRQTFRSRVTPRIGVSNNPVCVRMLPRRLWTVVASHCAKVHISRKEIFFKGVFCHYFCTVIYCILVYSSFNHKIALYGQKKQLCVDGDYLLMIIHGQRLSIFSF